MLKIFIIWTIIAVAIMCVYFARIKCKELKASDIIICALGIYFAPPLAIFALFLALSKR